MERAHTEKCGYGARYLERKVGVYAEGCFSSYVPDRHSAARQAPGGRRKGRKVPPKLWTGLPEGAKFTALNSLRSTP